MDSCHHGEPTLGDVCKPGVRCLPAVTRNLWVHSDLEKLSGSENENNKVSKLLTRTEQIRVALQTSGNSYIEILPIIITAIPRNGIENDIKEAAHRGVVIATKENVENLLQYIQLQLPPTPIEIFAEAKFLLNQATLPSN